MKKIILLFFLCLNFAWGQPSTPKFEKCVVKSRNNNNIEIPFNVNNPLAAIRLRRIVTPNALFSIEGKKVTFYVFQGKNVDKNLLNNASFDKITYQTEGSDIYLTDNDKGIVVLRRGEFIFRTFLSSKPENYSITKFEAVLDTIPKEPYYFDFRGRNTTIKKDCYETLHSDGKYAPFDHQGFGKQASLTAKPEVEPEVEWVRAENFSDILKFEKVTNDKNFQKIFRLNMKLDSVQANTINSNIIYTFYKLENHPEVYRIMLKFDFGCKQKKNGKSAIIGNTPVLNNPIIIYPPDRPLKQPDPTGLGVTPPSL